MQERLVWAILLSRHVHSTMQFYRDAAGWSFEAFPAPGFPCWIARTSDEAAIAVFVDASGSDFPDASELWLPHFIVDDLDRRLRAAEEQGAAILRAPFDIPGFGRVAALRQPGGGIVAWRSAPAS
jgi:predicted enzyme related to lactoylglutathione lyase